MQIELLKFPYSYMEYEKILQIRERKVLLPEIEVLSDDKHSKNRYVPFPRPCGAAGKDAQSFTHRLCAFSWGGARA